MPGNSGDSNPHGSPPGQRIVSPGTSVATSGATPPAGTENPRSGPSQGHGPSPAPVPGVNREFLCPPRCEPGAQKGLQAYDEVLRFLGSVQGWEPGWEEIADGLDGVQVVVRTEETRGIAHATREVRWQKGGGVERGIELLPDSDTHEWLLLPGVHWSRRGHGPWTRAPQGPARRLADLHRPLAGVIECVWDATPVGVERNWNERSPLTLFG